MRAGAVAIAVSMMVGALICAEEIHPFIAGFHGWVLDLAVALSGTFALASALASVAARLMHERCAAIASIGGAMLAAAFIYADIVAGAPARVASAPGQVYVPASDARVAIDFPEVNGVDEVPFWPEAVTVRDGDRVMQLAPDDAIRAGPFVFTAVRWPIARVRASDMRARPATVTQPNGAAFLSPFLTFPEIDTDGRPVDYFSVPPLHRDVGVKFFNGLPSRGITVPFLVLQIREENGATLYDGVAVDRRPIASSGLRLEFALGTYPSVIATGAAPIWLCALGIALVVGGFVGYALSLPTKMKRPEP